MRKSPRRGCDGVGVDVDVDDAGVCAFVVDVGRELLERGCE